MNRIKIWGKNIPLNTGHNKLEAMNFQQNATIASVMNDLFSFIGNSNFHKISNVLLTMLPILARYFLPIRKKHLTTSRI